ncbi:MAG: hypothetical protein RLZZ543_391 [Bacteroidota bacterium]|jgi:GNAT superfamily N-acetyltransferase
MGNSNFERLIQLADSVFSTRNDPDQLDVDQDVLAHLENIHPNCVSELDEGEGPVCWVLMFPTTHALMQLFLKEEISEKELYNRTPLNTKYDCIYLCSALVLEEFRRKGIASQLGIKAIEEIKKAHPIEQLFVWAFTPEGDTASEKLAQLANLPLLKRTSKMHS